MRKGVDRLNDGRNSFTPVPCIIALDQSYKRTGIAVCTKGKVRLVKSLDFKGMKSHTERRFHVQKVLSKIIQSCLKRYQPNEICILVERVRTFTGSDNLRPPVIKAQAALIAYIVDTGYIYNIKTFSVDTRAWKSKVLGDSRPIFPPIEGVKNPQKFGSVRKAIELGFKQELSVYRGKVAEKNFSSYNDDLADAICMSLYTFCKPPHSLVLER